MIGFPGSGKSSMAAYMVKKCLQNSKYKLQEEGQVQGYIDKEVDKPVPLVMIGFPGSGKSSMAAYMVWKCLQNSKYKVGYKK